MKFQGKIGGELTGRISGMRLVLTSRLSKRKYPWLVSQKSSGATLPEYWLVPTASATLAWPKKLLGFSRWDTYKCTTSKKCKFQQQSVLIQRFLWKDNIKKPLIFRQSPSKSYAAYFFKCWVFWWKSPNQTASVARISMNRIFPLFMHCAM